MGREGDKPTHLIRGYRAGQGGEKVTENRGLEGLRTWKQARQLVLYVYREVVPLMPADEKWGLVSQMRRAAVSVAANIAEGYGRYYYQDNVRYCYNARGSLDELLTHVLISGDLGYLPPDRCMEAKERVLAVRRVLNGYIRFLKERKRRGDESVQ
jgi:four helix bundle protein